MEIGPYPLQIWMWRAPKLLSPYLRMICIAIQNGVQGHKNATTFYMTSVNGRPQQMREEKFTRLLCRELFAQNGIQMQSERPCFPTMIGRLLME
jgi:hypothetical protein